MDIKLTLKVLTCYKGHVYAIPAWVHDSEYACPMCSSDSVWNAEQREIKLENTIRGLRGENTKLRERM